MIHPRRLPLATQLAGIILVPAALMFAGIIPAVQFNRERIELTVRPEAIDVNGLYLYVNPFPIPWRQGLRIPFPVDVSHPAPATVKVTEVSARSGKDLRAIPVIWFWDKPHFSLRVPASGAAYVRVQFTQPSATRSATYLLTTTKPWGRPMERGEYVLRPRGVRITGSNYPLEAEGGLGFVRQHFMPDKEWTFTWNTE